MHNVKSKSDDKLTEAVYNKKKGNCSVPSQLQAKIHAESPVAMGFLLGRGTLSYGQRSGCAVLLNRYKESIYEETI